VLHISPFDLPDRDHDGLERIDTTRRHTVNRAYDLCGYGYGIDPFMRSCRMPSLADDTKLYRIYRGISDPLRNVVPSHWKRWVHMRAGVGIHVRRIEDAVTEHRCRPCQAFRRMLEDKVDIAARPTILDAEQA